MKKLLTIYLAAIFLGILSISNTHATQSKRIDVLIIGNASSGKTWLRACLLGENPSTFESEYRAATTTVNAAFSSITVDDKQVSLLYWDSPGDPSVHDQLLTFAGERCQFIILTMDLTKHTLGSTGGVDIVEDLLNDWLMSAARQYPEAHLIVACTKKDATSSDTCNEIINRLNAFKGYGRYKGRYDCVLTSAKRDIISVRQIEAIIKRVLSSWGQSKFNNLPIFELPKNGETIKLPCGRTIYIKKGLCQIL